MRPLKRYIAMSASNSQRRGRRNGYFGIANAAFPAPINFVPDDEVDLTREVIDLTNDDEEVQQEEQEEQVDPTVDYDGDQDDDEVDLDDDDFDVDFDPTACIVVNLAPHQSFFHPPYVD